MITCICKFFMSPEDVSGGFFMEHEKYMRRAIQLAKLGMGKVNPNPLVGAVIVKDGKIIGEGYHVKYGELHAERHAFSKLEEDAAGATMYVTLEPCCHYGKQPPCVEAIIEHGIKKVYIGSDDPNEQVCGKGIEILRNAGIEVVTQFLKDECDELNPVFFHYITTKTPYVVMKYAMTMDGKIATWKKDSQWITNEEARQHVHNTRNALSGIMVGIGTVLADNPMLTCRIKDGRNPVRIILDGHLQIPLESNLVKSANDVKTYVVTLEKGKEETKKLLQQAGVEILNAKEKDGRIDLKDLMNVLGEKGIDSILLEGGATVNESALKAGIVRKVQMYVGAKIFGGVNALTPVGGIGVSQVADSYEFCHPQIKIFGDDLLIEYDVRKEQT